MASPSEQRTEYMTADLEKISSIKKLFNTAFYDDATGITSDQDQETKYVFASSAMPTDVVLARPKNRPDNRLAAGRARPVTSVVTEKENVTILHTSVYTAYETVPVQTTETHYISIPGKNETSTRTTVETQYLTLALPTTETAVVIEQERVPVTTTIEVPGPNTTVTHVSQHTKFETIAIPTTMTTSIKVPGENRTATEVLIQTHYETVEAPTTIHGHNTTITSYSTVPITTTLTETISGKDTTTTEILVSTSHETIPYTTTLHGPDHTITKTRHTTLPGHETTFTTHEISYITTQETSYITVPKACPTCSSNTTYIVSTSIYPVTSTTTVTPISYITIPPSYITTTRYVTSTISTCSSMPCSAPISWSSWPTQCGGHQISSQSLCSPRWYTSWTTPSHSIWSTTICNTVSTFSQFYMQCPC